MTRRWRFDDLTNGDFAVFDINPNAGGSPALSRTLTSFPTVCAGGKEIIFQGADLPSIITFSGVILSVYQLQLYQTWFAKLHQVQLTDDLNRISMVVITDFKPVRIRFGHNFNRHTFTSTCSIVDGG